MSFFLTDSQEDELNLFLDEQNRQACEEQLKSRLLPDDLSEIIKKSVEADSPLPAFDPIVGYYTISFTPCSDGNRIYAHHHINNKSISLCDQARDDIFAGVIIFIAFFTIVAGDGILTSLGW